MEDATNVIEYKCPCYSTGLSFQANAQKLKCKYCGNIFDVDSVKAFNESLQLPQTKQLTGFPVSCF